MKKVLLLVLIFFTTHLWVSACQYETKEINTTGKTTLALNIRSAPCTKGTTILGKTKIWTNYSLIGEAKDYYAIQYKWKTAFIWKKWVTITSSPLLSEKEKKLISLMVKKIQSFDSIEQRVYKTKLKNAKKSLQGNKKVELIITNILQQLEPVKKKIVKQTTKVTNTKQKDSDEATVLGKYWLSLYNNYRKQVGVQPYKYDSRLQHSAEIWSTLAAKRWEITHKRDAGDSYYDFWKIQDWFKENGVNCKVQDRTAGVENIGWGVMYCNKDNCEEELKQTVKKTFDFYMSEKGQDYQPHYKSIVAPYLGYIGFGIYKEDMGNGRYKVYNTTHFCTEFAD